MIIGLIRNERMEGEWLTDSRPGKHMYSSLWLPGFL